MTAQKVDALTLASFLQLFGALCENLVEWPVEQ
jgi:hypothetical protein